MNTTYNTSNKNENANDYIIYLNSARDGYKLKTRDGVEIMQVTGSTLFKDLTPATATAPQPTEEDTTTAPEEVTTAPEATAETPVQEPEEVTRKETREEIDTILLQQTIRWTGNIGAEYLDTLDYTQATEQEPRKVMFGRAEVTEKRYTIGTPDQFGNLTTYGLERHYNRNGKRAMFTVYKDGRAIELRWYGKNNNTYKAELRCSPYYDYIVHYEVEDGKVIRAERMVESDPTVEPISIEFDDTNRPAPPRDLPAPAPSKTTTKEETTKEAPATTEQEQPTSKPAPTAEETTAPEEVQQVTTSKQEDEPAPYWLLLDNELRAQQEEQGQAPATTEATEEEPAEEPAPDNEETDDLEEVVFLKGAELEKAIAEYADKNGLDIKDEKKYYYFYATPDGYIVKLDKSKPKKDLYIADEGPYFDSYQKGEITNRDIFFEQNMKILGEYARKRLESPVSCNVRRTMTGNLSIDPFGKTEYSYDPATGKSEEIPVKHPTTRELAVYVAARDAYEADQRARLKKYWKRYGHKVWVNTYWADR